MKLTHKQEAFAQAFVTGLNQSDAYRAAYKVRTGTKPESVNQNASRIMADINVASRVKALQTELANKSLWTREQSVAVLVDVIGEGDSKAGDKISAVKVLNDMQGFNAPTKLDVAVTFPRVINVISGRA